MPFLVVATNQQSDHNDSNTPQETRILQITLIYNKKGQNEKWSLE